MCHKFPLKFIPQYFRADKKAFGSPADFPVSGKSAAGNNAVHVHMVIELLVPSVENLDNSGSCPEILSVSRQFEKCLSTAAVKEAVEQLLVAVNERI